MENRAEKWQGRPVVAGVLRVVITVAPIAISIVLVTLLGRSIPRPDGWLRSAGWWAAMSAIATVALVAMDKLFRKLLPVVALFRLSLVFPDKAPSRFTAALRTGTVRQLKRRMDSGEFSSVAPQEAAEQLIGLASALNAHDRLTRGHTERVRAYSVMIGQELKLDEEELEFLNWSGLVHDIGKLAVPTEILNKPGKPSDVEWEVLRGHPAKADALVEPLRPWLGEWAESATQHHERFDGDGYPYGLAGRDISLAGRIVAVADAYDVMTSIRSYKKAMPGAEAREELAVNAGSQFDPAIVRAFLGVSMGRLRLVAGPLGSLVQLPAGSASLGNAAATGAGAVTTVAIAAFTGLLSPPIDDVQRTPIPDAVAMTIESRHLQVNGTEDMFLSADLGVLIALPGAEIQLRDIPDEGRVEVSAEGLVTFTPDENFNGTVEVQYSACFKGGDCDHGTITFVVAPMNDPPVAASDTVTLDEDTVSIANILANDLDIDGDPLRLLSIRVIEDPGNVIALVEMDVDRRSVTIQGRPNAWGSVLLEYTTADPSGATASATVLIDITPVNDAPEAFDDSGIVVENTQRTFDVLANDVDIDADALRIRSITDLVGGSATTNGNSIVFMPTARYIGPASLTYSIEDHAGETVSARLILDVLDDPSRPALAADNLSTFEDQNLVIDVLRNDPSPAAPLDTTTLAISRQAANGTASVGPGGVLYSPKPNWSGVDTFDYFACDVGNFCGTSSVNVTVTAVNDAPQFIVGIDVTVAEDSRAQTIAGWAAAISTGPPDEASQTAAFSVTASDQTLFSVQPAITPDGELSFTTTPDSAGSAVLLIELVDDGGTLAGGVDTYAPDSATVTVIAENDPPIALDDRGGGLTTPEDTLFTTTDVTANDSDIDDIIDPTTTSVVAGPSNGTLTKNGDGTFDYDPAPNFFGSDTFTYTITDPGLLTSNTATVTITVAADNDAPTATDDSGAGFATFVGTLLTTPDVTVNDSDIDDTVDPASVAIVSPPATGTVTNNGDGTFDFDPAAGWTGTETFTYTITDPALLASNIATVRIDVSVAPIADAGGPYSIIEGDNLPLAGSASAGSPTSWNWDLDNDGVYDDASGVAPLVPWATLLALGIGDDGTYPIGLEIDGGADSKATTLTIANVAPVLTTVGATNVTAGTPYTLNLAAIDPGEDLISTWTISWGDGTIDIIAGNPSSATHTYTRVGFTFDILVSATDEDGTVLQNELLVPSFDGNTVFRFAETSGAFLQSFVGADVPIEAHIGPDGTLYVSSELTHDVRRYNAETGAFIEVFVGSGSGGLNGAEGLASGPDGHLYVSNHAGDNVLRFDGTTGAFIDIFASTGVTRPYDIIFGPDSNLYVGNYTTSEIVRLDGTTGAFIDVFVTSGNGGLDTPEQMAFGPDGNLYVASFNSGEILRYDGATGAFIDIFIGAGGPSDLDMPAGLVFGPDGELYVADHLDHAILRYKGTTGIFLNEYVSTGSGGLTNPDLMTFLAKTRVTIDP